MFEVFLRDCLQKLKQSDSPVDFFLDFDLLLFVEIPEIISIKNYLSNLFAIHGVKLAN
jgi:hypothetical protein